jgi:hypothetical protein
MMKKFCQLQRLTAQNGLDCASGTTERTARGVKFDIEKEAYNEIFTFCRNTMPDLCSFYDVPHPKGSKVLSNYAKEISTYVCDGGMQISKHSPNNIIEYTLDNQTRYSQVCEIIELMGAINPIIVKVIPAKEVIRTDQLAYHFRQMNVLHIQLCQSDYLHASQVLMPVAYPQLPAWSFGVLHPSYLIRPLGRLSEAQLPGLDDMILD